MINISIEHSRSDYVVWINAVMKSLRFYFGMNTIFDFDAVFFSTFNMLKYLRKTDVSHVGSFKMPKENTGVNIIRENLAYTKPSSYSISLCFLKSEPINQAKSRSHDLLFLLYWLGVQNILRKEWINEKFNFWKLIFLTKLNFRSLFLHRCKRRKEPITFWLIINQNCSMNLEILC